MSRTEQPPVRRPTLKKTGRDMLLTLAVVLGAVAVIYLLVPRPNRSYVPEVDLAVAAEQAREVGQAPVVEPPTPDGWTVTSARLDRAADGQPATWQVGYLTDDDTYAALRATNEASDSWISEETDNGYESGVQDVNGQPWRTFVSREDGRTYLLRSSSERATIVGGSAVLDDLVELAGLTEQP